jgi:hypothetical protein
MMTKQSSILNNDFYIFILILLLIIMLFMLSPKDKEGFNINISKIKLNNKEPFQEGIVSPSNCNEQNIFCVKFDDNGGKFYLILNKNIVEDDYIVKNDIIKLYNTANEENIEYFNILKVEYNPDNNYKLEIDAVKIQDVNKINFDSAKVMGNKYENCVLSSSIIFRKHDTPGEGDYELVFDNKDTKGKLLIDPDEKEKIMNNFKEEDVIEIHHESIAEENRLFFIKKISMVGNKIILNNKNNTLIIPEGEQILIKKFDLNEIIKEYYEDKKQYNINYLVTKKKINNIGHIVDNIKETMNKN